MNIIKVSGLRKKFQLSVGKGEVEVLKGLDFEVESGKITGFLGANGAGKTTTMKCLLGLIQPTKGEFSFFGEEGLSVDNRHRLGFLPERPYFYEYLTGREFLRFYAELTWTSQLGNISKAIEEKLEMVDLVRAGDTQLRSYSKGMLQRIGFAQAIIHQPELIILDEPMAGLDPDGRSKLGALIRDVAASGTSIFFSSHLLHDVENMCQNLVIMKEGHVAFQGSTDSFLQDLESGFEVKYRLNNNIVVKTCGSQEELQKLVQDAIAQKGEIVSVLSKRPSLEEAFVKLSFGGGHSE